MIIDHLPLDLALSDYSRHHQQDRQAQGNEGPGQGYPGGGLHL